MACSGGPDSQALLDLLYDVRDELGFELVGAAHFDHRQRPDSARDSECVRDLARRLQVGLQVGEWRDAPPGGASEEEAREARYQFLFGTAAAWAADRIALAHSADDQAESLLMALMRGTGPDGLAAMPIARDPVIRPALEARRAELRRHCEERQIPFIDDPANLDARFTRVRVRREVLPLLEAVQKDAIPGLARAARLAAEEREGAEAADAILWDWADGVQEEDCANLSRAKLAGLPEALARRLLRHAGLLLLGRLPGWPAERLEAAARAIGAGAPGAEIELGRGVSMRLSPGRVEIRQTRQGSTGRTG